MNQPGFHGMSAKGLVHAANVMLVQPLFLLSKITNLES